MNILFIGFDIGGVGGIATYSRYQIRALRELGHHVEVLSLDMKPEPVVRGVVDLHVPFDNKYLAVPRMLRHLLRRRERFDVVFVNHVFLAWFGLAARAMTGARYVVNVYNIDILTRLPALREYAFARADLVIADCQYTIDRLKDFHARVPPVGLLYDPVDTGFFRPIRKEEARADVGLRFGLLDLSSRFVIVTVAALLLPPNKGHRQTIEALARLKDPRFVYLIAGSGPDREAIAEHAKAFGVADQVRLLGYVPQEALPALYSAADVAVLVARGGPGWGEAVPLGLIEASACGTAFICGNEDGSVEAIDPARPNGIAIGPQDVEALARELRRLADDRALTAAMGAAGIGMVDRVFHFRRFTEQQRALLARVSPRAGAAATAASGAVL